MLLSLVEIGVPMQEARRMSFTEASVMIAAHNDSHAVPEDKGGGGGGGRSVRSATQADIKSVFG